MKVERVSLLNIDDLYEAVLRKQNDEDYRFKQFGMNLPQLLSHMSISFSLSEVSAFEYIFLKNYVRTLTPFEKDHSFNISYIENNFKDIYETGIDPLFGLLKTINIDKNIDSLLPLGIITGKTTVNLSGEGLVSVIGLDPTTFFINFKKTLNIPTQLEVENFLDAEMKELLEDESFINYVISSFINNFYKFMMDKIMYLDPVSEAFNHSLYMDRYRSGLKVLSLQSYDFLINFESSNNSAIFELLDKYKNDHLNESVVNKMDSLKVELGMKTDLHTFFILYNILPLECFTSVESFITVNEASHMSRNIHIPRELQQVYGKRCNSRLTTLLSEINAKYSDKSNIVKKFMLTMGYAHIKYTISLSILDYNRYLSNIDISKLDEETAANIKGVQNWCRAFQNKII